MTKLRVLAAMGISFLTACTNIGPSEVGVLVDKCSNGGVQMEPLKTGYRYISPFCEDVVEFPTKVNNFILSESPHEGEARNTEVHIQSKENMDLKMDLALAYRIDPDKAPAFYKKWKITGENLHQFENNFVLSIIRENLRAEVIKLTAEEVYTQQEKVRGAVQAELVARLGMEGLIVENFAINQIRPPESVKAAIEAKVAAIQAAQAAENKVRQIKAQASQAVAEAEGRAAAAEAQAKGEAAAKRLKADAEAYYITTVNKSLTKEFVDYTKAQRWNGELPRVTSGGGTILQLKE